MNVSELIDQFVVFIDPSRTIFRKIESAPWIDALETKLPRRLPASFRSLVLRYAFPSFDAGHLRFFANTGDDASEELAVGIFRDQFIANATLKAGYIQFARPQDGSYDPICFDARRSVSNREFPIVRLDHEAILCHDRIREAAPISKSFYRFVADLVDRA
jgi:hypothetical protein